MTCPTDASYRTPHWKDHQEFFNPEEVAAHARSRHPPDFPMRVNFLCMTCDESFEAMSDIVEHMQDQHRHHIWKTSFTALAHLCMYPRCPHARHLFEKDHDLSRHVAEMHGVAQENIFLYKTRIEHYQIDPSSPNLKHYLPPCALSDLKGDHSLKHIQTRHSWILEALKDSFLEVTQSKYQTSEES